MLRGEKRGACHTIFRELAIKDTLGFSEYMRMPHEKMSMPGDGVLSRKHLIA